MAGRRETITLGIALAVAVLAAVMGTFVWIAVPLLCLRLSYLPGVWNLGARRHLLGVCRTGNYLLRHWRNLT